MGVNCMARNEQLLPNNVRNIISSLQNTKYQISQHTIFLNEIQCIWWGINIIWFALWELHNSQQYYKMSEG